MKLGSQSRFQPHQTAVAVACLLTGFHLGAAERPPLLNATDAESWTPVFSPLRIDQASLSPDGKMLAYSQREDRTLYVVVIEVDHPKRALARVPVADDETSTPVETASLRDRSEWQREATPAKIHWLGWSSSKRLVVETNTATRFGMGAGPSGVIAAFNFDGSQSRVIARPIDVKEAVMIGGLRPKMIHIPRAPHVSRLTERENEIEIWAFNESGPVDERSHTVYRLNTETGALKELGRIGVLHRESYLSDFTASSAVLINDLTNVSLPRPYDYRPAEGKIRHLHEPQQTAATSGFVIPAQLSRARRSVPLGFDESGRTLYYASNMDRDLFGIYGLDLATGAAADFRLEDSVSDLIPPLTLFGNPSLLLFDRFTRKLAGVRVATERPEVKWLTPDLQEVQHSLEGLLPGRRVELREWSRDRKRFLALAYGPGTAGQYYLFAPEQKRMWEFEPRRRALADERESTSEYFSYVGKSGVRISGILTWPTVKRLARAPLLLLCSDDALKRVSDDYRPEIAAFCRMGFAVAQLNTRGTWGTGRRNRERVGPTDVTERIDDLIEAARELPERFNLDAKRVALAGSSYGGFLALRALQQHPEHFRCAIALNGPVDLHGWMEERFWRGDSFAALVEKPTSEEMKKLKSADLTKASAALTKPAQLFFYSGPRDHPAAGFMDARSFANRARATNPDIEFQELSADYQRGFTEARGAVFARIAGFVNLHVYDAKVKLGPLEIKDR